MKRKGKGMGRVLLSTLRTGPNLLPQGPTSYRFWCLYWLVTEAFALKAFGVTFQIQTVTRSPFKLFLVFSNYVYGISYKEAFFLYDSESIWRAGQSCASKVHVLNFPGFSGCHSSAPLTFKLNELTEGVCR